MIRNGETRLIDRLSVAGAIGLLALGCGACSGKSEKVNPAPSPTTTPLAMRQWHEDGYALKVPADWSSTKTNTGGSFDDWKISSPDGLEVADVTIDFCTNCIRGAQYTMDTAKGLNPSPNADDYLANAVKNGGVIVSPREVKYTPSMAAGTVGRGLMLVSHDFQTAVDVHLTMKASDSSIADQIMASLQEAS